MKPSVAIATNRVNDQRGVTIVELLVVVTIIGIMSAMAAPSFGDFIRNQRVKAMATDLHIALIKARSESIKRNVDISIVPNTAGAWQDGWTIPDPAVVGALIDSQTGYYGLVVTSAGGGAAPAGVIYQGSGRISGNVSPSFSIGATGSSVKRCVSIDLSGRPYTKAVEC